MTDYDDHATHVEEHRRHVGWVWAGRWSDEDWARGWRPAANDVPRWVDEPASWAVDTSEGTNEFEHESDAVEFTRLARLGGQHIFDEPTFQPAVHYDSRRTFTCRDITAPSLLSVLDDALREQYLPSMAAALYDEHALIHWVKAAQ